VFISQQFPNIYYGPKRLDHAKPADEHRHGEAALPGVPFSPLNDIVPPYGQGLHYLYDLLFYLADRQIDYPSTDKK
jgi:hypothetical protein